MACRKVSTYNGIAGSGRQGGGGYVTEADCLQACKEGACCESNGTCSVTPQCQCQGTGQTFHGVAVPCDSPTLGGCCGRGSCCGPSTFTNVLGQTRYTCQQFTSKAQCDAIGGSWTLCGVCAQCGDEKNSGPCGCESINPLP